MRIAESESPQVRALPGYLQTLSVKDLATLLRLSERQIRKLLAEQRLPEPIRVGGSIRWRRSTVQEWLDTGCPTGPVPPAQQGGAQ